VSDANLYLQIPTGNVAGLTFIGFADHVVDHSPVVETRSQLRLILKAREAIDAQQDGVVEMPRLLGELWQRACAEAPIPRRLVGMQDAAGQWIGEPDRVPARAYDRFYEAVEGMSTTRPKPAAAPAQAAE
jgi:hypothetical protein